MRGQQKGKGRNHVQKGGNGGCGCGRLQIHNIALQSPTDRIGALVEHISTGRLSLVTGFSNARDKDPKVEAHIERRWTRMDVIRTLTITDLGEGGGSEGE